ncbi:MAG TPA: flagellar hook-basal body complex protein FliE [Candidatus Accumulibacter phosphatis]|nr:flagellar hook-basal body complex protein FliE [Accumulibacter sp.]HCN69841.1 flagellar hook-basal body complex protein FliE [Accumulibacter sp.]HCV12957.1 flagellar hook-basal body complex protein FliE [Accumulibacter sp.]HRL77887.1 flagellar hook-basal body complex protein FliE [Candidatus Accumulibacter phosphatis]HRQ96178.1 flagellar hook-basal body complex protein FliE [Candidatus Accumulibacter phosphatis]
MDHKGIDQVLNALRATSAAASGRAAASPAPVAGGPPTDFAEVLQASLAQVSQTQERASEMAASFAAGNAGADLHDVMIELQKASISFQEMVQVRNKLVSAYQDVMNMQV